MRDNNLKTPPAHEPRLRECVIALVAVAIVCLTGFSHGALNPELPSTGSPVYAIVVIAIIFLI